MAQESSTFGLSPEQMARLLKIGSDSGQAEGTVEVEQEKAELLRDWLNATLPLDAVFLESLPAILRGLREELKPLAGEPFGKLLQDPKTELSAIKKIKDYSKKLVLSARSEAEHDAASAIYYAAIASALVFHNRRITKFSSESLGKHFSALTEHRWLTQDLTRLFQEARKHCVKKAERKVRSEQND